MISDKSITLFFFLALSRTSAIFLSSAGLIRGLRPLSTLKPCDKYVDIKEALISSLLPKECSEEKITRSARLRNFVLVLPFSNLEELGQFNNRMSKRR